MTEEQFTTIDEASKQLAEVGELMLRACEGYNRGVIMPACMLVIAVMIEDSDKAAKIAAIGVIQESLNYLRNLIDKEEGVLQ